MLSFSWFCKDFAQNIDNLPSFYPFFAKNCKESRPDGLTIRWGKTCGILKIYQLINLTFYYLSDGLLYLYRVLTLIHSHLLGDFKQWQLIQIII